jgi:hypothetical protein
LGWSSSDGTNSNKNWTLTNKQNLNVERSQFVSKGFLQDNIISSRPLKADTNSSLYIYTKTTIIAAK